MQEIKLSEAIQNSKDAWADGKENLGGIVFAEPLPVSEYIEVARVQGQMRGLEEWLNTPEQRDAETE